MHPVTKNPRRKLMAAAEKLFASHGIAGVGVRAIVKAAGHKNANSLHYHFGNKENLVNEIIREGAVKADDCRRQKLDFLKSRKEPIGLRDVIKVLLAPTIERAVTPSFTKLLFAVLLEYELVNTRALRWPRLLDDPTDLDAGLHTVDECERMIAKSAQHVSKKTIEERTFLFHAYMLGFLVIRDEHLSSSDDLEREVWASRYIVEDFVDTAEALLLAEESDLASSLKRKWKRSNSSLSGKKRINPAQIAFSLFE